MCDKLLLVAYVTKNYKNWKKENFMIWSLIIGAIIV